MRLEPEAVSWMRVCFADAAAEAAGERLLRLADERGWQEVCLDLGGVPHLSSGWLATLLALNRRLRNRGGRLRLVNVAEPAYEALRLAHLHTALDVHPCPSG
jgi:anti-sigma B factor antagonist